MNRRSILSSIVVVAALVAAACGGGGSPTSPSGSGSVLIHGVVLNPAAGLGVHASGVGASDNNAAASTGKITVTVEGTNLTTTVSSNGTFEIEGAPAGTFTLVFKSNGVEIGRVQVTAQAGAEVKITVQVQNSTVAVVSLEVDDKDEKETETETEKTSTCLLEGGKVGKGVELEGKVASGAAAAFKLTVNGERGSGLVDVSASSASFKCNGEKKLTDAECKATVKAGAQVHVRGTLMTCTTSAATVTATEVKVQKAESHDDEKDDD